MNAQGAEKAQQIDESITGNIKNVPPEQQIDDVDQNNPDDVKDGSAQDGRQPLAGA